MRGLNWTIIGYNIREAGEQLERFPKEIKAYEIGGGTRSKAKRAKTNARASAKSKKSS